MYNTSDIDGTTSNSAFNRSHFMDVFNFINHRKEHNLETI